MSVKRTFDFSASLVGTIFLSPLLIGIALAVRLSLGTPVLYRQTRPGGAPSLFG